MGVIPEVRIQPAETKIITQPGMAGTVAIVGAFPPTVPEKFAANTLKDAKEIVGADTSYSGVSAINQIFRRDGGASSVVCANITTTTGSGDNVAEETVLTTQKLAAALTGIKGERFDILFVAADLDDNACEIIKDFLDEAYDLQKPFGLIAPTTRDNISGENNSYQALSNKMKSTNIYGLISQQWKVDGVQLNLVETAAYYCGIVAGKKVDESMTMKYLPGVEAISPEYTFSEGEDGAKLVGYGMTIARCIDRANNKYAIVNSEQPSGLDLSIERTKDFVIRQVAFETQLGNKTKKSVTAVRSLLETKKQLFKDTLEIIEDMSYVVEKASSNCIDVYLDSIVFGGILTKINVYVTVEVE